MLPESNPKKSCRGSHHALRLHRNLLQSQAPPLSARLSLPTRVRKTLEQSNKPTKLNNCLSAFSKTDQMVKSGLITRTEVENGRPAPGSPKATPALIASAVPGMLAKGRPKSREVLGVAPFKVGQRVRARNIHPTGHTRLPRYARGKLGTVHLDHGVYVFPDTNADSLGEKPQHLYSVRFAARELWGEQASSRDAVYLDMWDDYLECA